MNWGKLSNQPEPPLRTRLLISRKRIKDSSIAFRNIFLIFRRDVFWISAAVQATFQFDSPTCIQPAR